MPKRIESQWRDEGRMMRAFEQTIGERTLEKFNTLSPEGQRKVLETVVQMKAELGKDPQALVEAMPAIVAFYEDVRGGITKNERAVYDTESGPRVGDDEIMRMETQAAMIEERLSAAAKPARREIMH